MEVVGGDVLLIGVDGGATEAKAHAVACDDLEHATSFELRPESASRVYPSLAGFAPVPVAEQLAQWDAGAIRLTDAEAEQGRLFVEAAAEAVVDIARQCAATRVLVGVGMPGLKTADLRGIRVINNGPRMPVYLDTLERHVAAAGLELVSPVAALGSDADYCGLGEEFAADGLFRDVENAYYFGGGTGIADALKLRGELVPFDAANSWIQKSWQMPSALGATFEKLISAKSLNAVYDALCVGTGQATKPRSHGATKTATEPRSHGATEGNVAAGLRTGRSGAEVAADVSSAVGSKDAGHFPEADAAGGDAIAIAWMETAALVLAELIFERLRTIRNGRADAPQRGDAYAQLDVCHAFCGVLLDRVVIGQRVGMIYGDAAYRGVFGDKVDACLAGLIAGSGDEALVTALLSQENRRVGQAHHSLRSGFLVASKLRAAPALGAAVAAVRALG